MLPRGKKSATAGFTLVEALVSVMVLSFALGACILSFSMAMRVTDTARNQMASLHHARNQLESLRVYKFTNSVLNAGTYAVSNASFTGFYTISNVNTHVKDITVGVRYQNRLKGGISTNTLTTSFSRTLH